MTTALTVLEIAKRSHKAVLANDANKTLVLLAMNAYLTTNKFLTVSFQLMIKNVYFVKMVSDNCKGNA